MLLLLYSLAVPVLFDHPIFLPRFFLPFSLTCNPSRSLRGRTATTRWQPFRKRKVVMRVGYVGTEYTGLQLQRDPGTPKHLEAHDSNVPRNSNWSTEFGYQVSTPFRA